MGSLDVEGFLDFGVGREEEVDEDDGWDEEGKEGICDSLFRLNFVDCEYRKRGVPLTTIHTYEMPHCGQC